MKNPIYTESTATLAEVARKAGVSRQTAGRILGTDAHKHRPDTVERVRAAAEKLGYRPNLLAKSIVAGRTYSIGVLMPPNSDTYCYQIGTGIHDRLSRTDLIPIFLQPSSEHPEHEQIHRLVDRRVDGVLLFPTTIKVAPGYFNEIARRNIPVVCMNQPIASETPCDFAGTDEVKSSENAAEYLLRKGHRDLCVIASSGVEENLEERVAAFKNRAVSSGATCAVLRMPNWTLSDNSAAAANYLEKAPKHTAYFAVSDVLAVALYKAAEKLGLKIPADFSVIGFADLDFAAYLSPALTSMRQDGRHIGKIAADLLIERMNGIGGDSRELRFPAELIERDSVTAV